MAIIPRYTSRALPPGAQPGLTTSALKRGEAGAGLARAFGGAIVEGIDYKERKDAAAKAEAEAAKANARETAAKAEAAAKLADRIAAAKRRNENLDHQNGETTLARAETEITKGRAKAVASVKTGGGPAKGLALRALADFDGAVGKHGDELKNQPHLKARFDAVVESSRAPLELRMLTLENARRVDEEKAALAASLGGLALAAVDDPAMAPGVTGRGFAQIEGAMEAGMLTGEEAAGMQREFADNVHMAAMRGQIATDPEDMQTRLAAGEFDGIFEAPARDQLLGEARTAARVKGAQASAAARAKRRGLEIDMAGYLEDLAESSAGDEAVAARAGAELPEFQHAAFQAAGNQARERFATRAEYAFMTEDEIEADIAQQAPGGGPRDTDERNAAHAIRRETADEILAARAEDPAGWAMRDDDVATAFAAAQENPDDPTLARKAIQQRLALQREMGIEQPRLLSEAERDEIADQLAKATPADRPAIIADLRARYGAHAGMLAAELTGEIDANTALLLAHADMHHLPRLLANGMEKSAKDGRATLTLARPEDSNLLPALPIIDKGEHGGRKLDMGSLKNGVYYRAADGGVLLYDGEALIRVEVETASPDPAESDAPTPPLPLGKAGPERRTSVKDMALEREARGDPVAPEAGEESMDDAGMVGLEEADPGLPAGLEDDETGLGDGAAADGEAGATVDAQKQNRKRRNMAVWLGWAGFGGDPLPGWKELPRSDDGRIDRGALEDDQVYHVGGTDGRRSAWRWNEGERTFVPYGRWVDAFSIDGMHELTGVPVRRTSDGRPIYNMEQDRLNAINWDIDAVFEVADNPDAKGDKRWQDTVTSNYAKAKVFEHGATIERLAKEHGVNPDLVRAIMFREQAAGPLQPMADFVRIGKTISPMGINPEKWSGLGIDRATARNSEGNIRAAIILIKRIQDRIADPKVEKIATLYNGLMKEKVSDYGAQVGRIYQDKPWLDWDPSGEAERQEISP